MTRRRALILCPVGLVMGGWVIVSEINDHGLSGAVIAGLIGGALCACAIIALLVARWNRTWTAKERRDTKLAYSRARAYAPFGLAFVGLLIVFNLVFGNEVHNLGTALATAAGLVFMVGTILATIIAVTRHGPLYS